MSDFIESMSNLYTLTVVTFKLTFYSPEGRCIKHRRGEQRYRGEHKHRRGDKAPEERITRHRGEHSRQEEGKNFQ